MPPLPPVVTRLQFLPFQDLTWENYERICLRYIRLQGNVEYCQPYGVQGQDQEGIDFYARMAEAGKYAVYQCKRIRDFEPSDITKAVTDFLNGKWGETASVFVVCTSQSTAGTEFADAIESEARRLKERNIQLDILDAERFSERLKDKPVLVDDFFGRPWTRAFCGKEAANSLGERLDGDRVVEYRTKLADFYRILFTLHDPAIPVRPQIGSPDIDIMDRFVVPDVYSNIGFGIVLRADSSSEPTEKFNPETATLERRPAVQAQSGRNLRIRTSLDTWLSQADRSVVLGVPGSGKSALLRFLALDMLSVAPSSSRLAARWGCLLPVWVPFAYWSNLNSKGTALSIRDCLESWFRQFDQPEVCLLVEEALDDKRVLLLVDGLDEWESEVAGRTASNLLQTFIEERNVAAVVVSRPYGFERIGVHGAGWQVAELAPLSSEQQQELTLKWLRIRHHTIRLDSVDPGAVNIRADRDYNEFSRNLAKSADLSQLAETPLLLLLLLYLHIENVPLPDSRFAAYDLVINHFVREHSLGKRAAASVTKDESALTADEIRNAMAYVAAVVQERFPTGIIAESEIRPLLENFLKDVEGFGLGLSSSEARHVLRNFTNPEEGSLGLLVSQGHGNLSFFHRSLQEFLASVHLSRLPLSAQQSTVKDHLVDPRWREVLLGLVWLCHRNDDAESLSQSIQQEVVSYADEPGRAEILAELGFGDFKLGPVRAREVAEMICDRIETNTLMFHRIRLLTHVVSGMRSKKTRHIVRQRLRRWAFSRTAWGVGNLESLSLWPPTDHTWSVLSRALCDEEPLVKRAAAHVIAQVFKNSSTRSDFMAGLALASPDVVQRAAALSCLVEAWPDYPSVKEAVDAAGMSCSLELRLASIFSRVELGTHNQNDLSELLRISRNSYRGGVEYAWKDMAGSTLVRGWSGDPRLKAACLKGAERGPVDADAVDMEIAGGVLVEAFKQDKDVAQFIADELRSERAFGMGSGVWQRLPASFRDNAVVTKALDEWVGRIKQVHAYQPELSYAALVGRTDVMKRKLLESLDGWVPFWAAGALLEGWGMSDPAVSERLTRMALDTPRGVEIAQYIPSILQDPKEARERLLALMRDPSSQRLDFIVRGFSQLGERGDEDEFLDACLNRLEGDRDGAFIDGFRQLLILTFPNHRRIRDLSLIELGGNDPPLGSIAQAFASDEEIRQKVGELITPLATDLRFRIVSELPACGDPNLALELLQQWDSEKNAEVKTLACVNYNRLLREMNGDTRPSLQQLTDMIPCYGPDHEERRQAALAGLLTLRAVEAIRGKSETIGFEGQPVVVELSSGLKTNLVVAESIGKNWEHLKETFEGNPARLLQRAGYQEFWAELALVGADYPDLARDILKQGELRPAILRSSNVLNMIGRLEPRSERLLALCLDVLGDRPQQYEYGWFERAETAAALLAQHFRKDPAVETRLQEFLKGGSVPTGVVEAICTGWPESECVEWLVKNMGALGLSNVAQLYIMYATVNVTGLPSLLAFHLKWALENRHQADALVKAALARLRNDASVHDSLFEFLTHASDPSVKASFPRFLKLAAGLTSAEFRWCRDEIDRQSGLRSPEVGFDLFLQTPRVVTICLLECLNDAVVEPVQTV
jgi:hypothetical protein